MNNLITWDCTPENDVTNLSEFEQRVKDLKDKLKHYDYLIENKQISDGMYDTGYDEIISELACEIMNETGDEFNSDRCAFEFKKETITSENRSVGDIGPLCPECNRILNHEVYPNKDLFVADIDHVGTRMQLKNGKYGLFWSCMNYPQCKATVSTWENKRQNFKRLQKSSHLYKWIDDYDDYVPDVF